MNSRFLWYVGRCLTLLLSLTGIVMAQPIGYQAVPRDAFPVFDHPDMLSAEVADREGVIFPRGRFLEGSATTIYALNGHHMGSVESRSPQHYPILMDRFHAFYPEGDVFK